MKIIITESQYKILKESISDDQDFIEYIKDVEGKVIDKKTKLHKAYKDSVGVVTIGYGHSEKRDPNVKMGMKIPETKAISYLKDDLKTDESKVKNYVAEKFPGLNFLSLLRLLLLKIGKQQKKNIKDMPVEKN